MAKNARFRVDPKLAALLGEGYRSSELALKELIDNAWDADSTEVRVTLPAPLSGLPIVVQDDGTGMTEAEVRTDYLAVASDRTSRKGGRTAERNRVVKGRKGIGKFAGLVAADTMSISTRCRGVETQLTIRKEDLRPGAGDLEQINLAVSTSACSPALHGTTVTLSDLAQSLDPPSPERLKPLLMLEYGRQADFTLVVNGEVVGVDDIPGEAFAFTAAMPASGDVVLRFSVSEGQKALPQSGIAVRVTGKAIGKPTTFGLDQDEEIPRKLLKRVYGELEADGLANDITADWGAVIENSTAYAEVEAWAAGHLKAALTKVFAGEMRLARGRLTQQITRRLSELPEHRRPIAEKRIEKVLSTLYGEKEERVDAVVQVALDAIEQDDYFVAVRAISEAPREDVSTFAAALGGFGLADMAVMAEQARRRLAFLDDLDALIALPATREQELHVALEHNLWVLGAEYAVLSSNKTLRRVIEEFTGKKYAGARATERPDLLLISDATGKHKLIEFKRPSMDVTRAHEAQAIGYRDDLVRTLTGGIDVLVIGRAWAPGSDRTFVASGLTVMSYSALVSRARSELSWLLDQLTSESGGEPSPYA